MYVFQVCGYHQSGKTTTAKELIKRLKISGKSVASIKDIHREGFQIDPPNNNTYVHKLAGADPVVARGEYETDFLYHHKMEFLDIAQKISTEWLVVEGFRDFPLPRIVCGNTDTDVDDFLDRRTFAISGGLAHTRAEHRGLPVFNPLDADQANQLWELTINRVFPMLPYVDEKCCRLCGMSCSEMVAAIIQGERSYRDCIINQATVQLTIGDRNISMVPFVQKILKNNVMAVVRELDGWEENKTIKITILEL